MEYCDLIFYKNYRSCGQTTAMLLSCYHKLVRVKAKYANLVISSAETVKKLQTENNELKAKLEATTKTCMENKSSMTSSDVQQPNFLLSVRTPNGEIGQIVIDNMKKEYACNGILLRIVANDENQLLVVAVKKDFACEKATKYAELKEAFDAKDLSLVCSLALSLQVLTKEIQPTYTCYRIALFEATDAFMTLSFDKQLDNVDIKLTFQNEK